MTRIIYLGNFHRVATYGLIIWRNHPDIQEVFKLHKRALRLLPKLHFKARCSKLLIIPLELLLTCLTCVHLWMSKHNI